MYRILYLFSIGDLHLRLTGLVDRLYARKPELRKWSPEQLILAWVRVRLYEDSYLLLKYDAIDEIRPLLDWDFLGDQRCLTLLYDLAYLAIGERSERLLHTPCAVKIVRTELRLQFDLD